VIDGREREFGERGGSIYITPAEKGRGRRKKEKTPALNPHRRVKRENDNEGG